MNRKQVLDELEGLAENISSWHCPSSLFAGPQVRACNTEQRVRLDRLYKLHILTVNNYLCLQLNITVLLPLRQVGINHTAGSRIQIDHPGDGQCLEESG